MKRSAHPRRRQRSEADERRIREASLDRTIEASFPASDPPSTDPNPDAHDEVAESSDEDDTRGRP